MPCGGGSKHVLLRRGWLMTTLGSTGRRWKRRCTAIAMAKVVRSAHDQIGATETANNRISIEPDREERVADFIVDTMTATQTHAAERTHLSDVYLPRRTKGKCMSTTRFAFTSEALSTFERTMDEVLTELLADGVLSSRDVDEARTRFAQKLMKFASSGRSVIQIRRLLSRAVRNERSSARHRIACRGNGRTAV